MQWRKRQFTQGVLLLLTGMLCWYGSLGAFALYEKQWYGGRVSVRDPAGNQDFSSLKELRRQMKLNGEGVVTGWGQTLSEEIKAYATADSTRVDVVWLDGTVPMIWDLKLLTGQYPGQTDDIGCAMDDKTALKLFGTVNVIGKEVQIAGKRMTVRGVFSLPEGIAAIPSDPGRGLAFCPAALANESVHMTALEFIVRPGNGKTAKEQAAEWMEAAALSGSMDDHQGTNQWMALLTSLPGVLLMVLALTELYLAIKALLKSGWHAVSALKNDRSSTRRQFVSAVAIRCVPALLLAAAGVIILRLPAYRSVVPASFLPTRWSDFSFWLKKAAQILNQMVEDRLKPALRPDLAQSGLVVTCIALALLSLLLIWLSRRALMRGLAEASLAYAIACGGAILIAAPVFLWIVRRAGWIPEILPGNDALPIVFFAAFILLRGAVKTEKVRAWLYADCAGGMRM